MTSVTSNKSRRYGQVHRRIMGDRPVPDRDVSLTESVELLRLGPLNG
ncbi:MAG: hypothetical protein Q8K58_17035 [Acidimicrobiales bacterium]|nr:hypothetical protein [Acidimicrobiales bacterium]